MPTLRALSTAKWAIFGDPNGIRTRVAGMKTRCPDLTRRWGLKEVGRIGLEPMALGLKGRCSTN